MKPGNHKLTAFEEIEVGKALTIKSPTEVAKEFGVHPSTIYRKRSKDEVRQIIEEQSQRLLDAVPQAISNIVGLVDDFNATEEIDIVDKKTGKITGTRTVPVLSADDKKLAYKATERVLEAPGIIGSSTPSIQIGKMVITNNTAIIQPKVLEALQRSVEFLDEQDAEVVK